MLRHRLILLLAILVLCVASATAQSAAVQKAQTALSQAEKLQKEQSIEAAAGLFEQVFAQSGVALAGILGEGERQVWTKLYVRSGHDLACCYMSASYRDFVKARELLAAVEGHADAQSKTVINKRMAQAWSMEAMLAFQKFDWQASLSLFAHAAEAYHAIGDAPEEAQMIIYHAQVQTEMYQYGDALATLAEARRVSRAAGADLQLLEALKEERELCAKLGDSEARARAVAAIDSLCAHSADYSVRVEYNKMRGQEAMEQGRFAVAKTHYLANLKYADQQKPHQRDGFLSFLYGSLRDVCIAGKQYDEALDYAYKALQHDIFYRRDEPGHKYTLYSYIAKIHSLRGDSACCEAALDTLFLDLSHITAAKEKAQLYGLRAICHSQMERHEEALADWLKADSVLATAYRPDSPVRFTTYGNIGGKLCRLKRYAEAEYYYRLYADFTRATYGEESDDALYAQLYLANCEALAGHIDEGCRDYVAAIDKMRDIVRQRLPYSSAAERETMWRRCSEYLTDMTAFAIGAERTADDFTRASYEALMLSKAFLLDYERSTFDIVSAHGTPDDLAEYTRIVALNNRMLELQKAPSPNSEQIASLSSQVASLERTLARKCKAYGDVTAFMTIGYDAVQRALDPDDVVLDFTDYVHRKDGRRYAAYVVRAGQTHPLLVPLFAESQVDSLGVSHPDMFYSTDVAAALLELLWRPLAEHVTEGATVYYVPSHLLFQMALESIPLPDGSLLGDHYRFVRLSSAREVVRYDEYLRFPTDEQRAVLYGGLHYDLQPEVMAGEAAKYEVSPLLATRGEPLDRGTRYTDLAETGREVETVGAVLQGCGVDVSVRRGDFGTEESFLSMHGHAPAILHVATHGFYYTPDEASKVDYLKGYDDAMALSGLILSGGNAAWQGKTLPEGVLDGILTAGAIAAMDFRGVDMVVLSACKTAQGEATAEGLFGLQRAFKKAGAQTMVMTLWNVNDVTCREFMEAFYAHLTTSDSRWNKREAFDAARRAIKAKYPNPYYWAAFVMLD